MAEFTKEADEIKVDNGLTIHSFLIGEGNIDRRTVDSFSEEWLKFNTFSDNEINQIGDDYFDILPRELDMKSAAVLDMGCGTGRWAYYLADKVGFIECIDPSDAVYTAASLLKSKNNVRVTKTDVDNLPFNDSCFDLVYSLGVLHHIPDTAAAMQKCVEKVRKGGYFLVYLYYKLDNRGFAFRTLFKAVNLTRKGISRMPKGPKKFICDVIAGLVYFPLAKTSGLLKKAGLKKMATRIPLSYYSDKSFWVMKNDALDRFGTPLEQRFTKNQVRQMMERCGLTNIVFSSKEPYWHAIGQKL